MSLSKAATGIRGAAGRQNVTFTFVAFYKMSQVKTVELKNSLLLFVLCCTILIKMPKYGC